jgi:hypothetical protein
MRVTLQYFGGCPNWKIAESRVKAIIEEGGLDADLEYQLIETPEAAEELQFAGSPTLLIDGRDPFATGRTPIGLACRTYITETGPAESPSVAQLREALGAGIG